MLHNGAAAHLHTANYSTYSSQFTWRGLEGLCSSFSPLGFSLLFPMCFTFFPHSTMAFLQHLHPTYWLQGGRMKHQRWREAHVPVPSCSRLPRLPHISLLVCLLLRQWLFTALGLTQCPFLSKGSISCPANRTELSHSGEG